jgi:hypothetical protein
MFEELELDFYNSSEFWKKDEKERFLYYKNFMVIVYGLSKDAKSEDDKLTFSTLMTQLCLLVIFLLTTDEERQNEIELKWLDRFQKETKMTPFDNVQGEA